MEDGRLLFDDLLIEVLVCLPVRSIERFRCVSKYWCTLIKGPIFINSHLVKQRRTGKILMVKRYLAPQQDDDVLSFHDLDSPELEEVWPNLTIPFLKDLTERFEHKRSRYHKFVDVLGPCNELICFSSFEYFIVCNPTLQEFHKLPHHEFSCPKGYILRNIGIGFGSTCIHDFKVILIGRVDLGYISHLSSIVILLYSSRTNSWREIDSEPLVKLYVFYDPCTGVFFQGAYHWSAGTNEITELDYILAFDFRAEVFRQFEYSDSINLLYGGSPFLIVLNDCLAFVRRVQNTVSCYIDVWIMKNYGVKESWTKQCVVHSDPYIGSFLNLKNDEWMLVATGRGQLVSFALYSTDIKTFEIYGWEETLWALVYEPSLISVKQLVVQLLEGKPFCEEE